MGDLSIYKGVVRSLFGNELAVCAFLNNLAILNNCNDVSILDRAQSVGNDKACAALSSIIQSFLHNLGHSKERRHL